MPDIGDKEENVNAEQDLALKDDQVSTERRKSARTRDSC